MLSSSYSALTAQPVAPSERYEGGVFNRKPVAATSAAVPDTVPASKVWAALLQVDKSRRTNQVVVRINARSAALKTALNRSANPTELDTQPGFEAAFVKAVEAQSDESLVSLFGGALGARHLLIDARMQDRERIGADAADPREVMQQFIVLRYPDVAAALNAEALLSKSTNVLSVQNDVVLSLSTGTPTDTLYPIPTQSQPLGSVRLMRKYNPARDDHAIFPESELTNMANEGYTQNSGSDWLGYVYPNATGNVPTIQ